MGFRKFTEEFAEEANITKKESLRLLQLLIKFMKKKILKGEIVSLSGFGKFYIDVVPEREYHNVRTNEKYMKKKSFVLKRFFSKPFLKKIDEKKVY